jgi:glycerophosphoryl diester phosphodiesterase
MELIAHRAGNQRTTLEQALAVAHAAELDVHRFRGRIEVRHAKVLWPTSVRWDRWAFVDAAAPRPTLDDILERLPRDTHLWIDLKGFDRGLTREVLAATAGFDRLTVSSRSWWILAPAHGRETVRPMRSVGNRFQRFLADASARRSPRRPTGIVLHERLARPATVARLRDRGPVVAWGAVTLERALELRELGVTGVIIDDLELIRQIRGHLGQP